MRNNLSNQLTTGITSTLMACTGGAILIVQSAIHFNYSQSQLIAWLFMCYVAAGLFNLLLAKFTKLPIAGASSITGSAFLSTSPFIFSYNELIGAFLLASLFIFVLGASGLFQKLFQYIPRPVIDAMLAGIILQFIVKLVPIFKENFIVAALSLAGYLLSKLKFKSIPPMIFVISFGVIGLLFTTHFAPTESLPFSLPHFELPEFSWVATISIALPIAILVLSNDLSVAIASLKRNGFDISINKLLTLTGLASAISSFFSAHSVTVGGMMTTLVSSEQSGEAKYRYKAGIISSIGCIIFGIFAWLIVPYLLLLPNYFITIIVAFSLLAIGVNALRRSISHPDYRFAVVIAFIVSFSNVPFLNVSSALWSLIIGTLTAIIFKEGIYAKKEASKDEANRA